MEALLLTAFLLFLRAIGVVAVLPLPSNSVIQKTSLALALAILGVPWAVTQEAVTIEFCIVEVLTGLSVGLPFALAVSCAQMWGELFDSSRGQNMALILDPLSEHQLSPLATLFQHLSFALIIAAGGLLILMKRFLHSIQLHPPGSSHLGADWGERLLALVSHGMCDMLALALPVAALFLCIELIGGFCARMMPRLQLNSEVFYVKCIAAWTLLWVMQTRGGLAEFFPLLQFV